MTTSIEERNKQVVRDYFEKYWNHKDLDGAAELIKDDYNWHLEGGMEKGLEGWRKGVAAYFEVWPDCHWEVRQIVAEGDLVCVRCVWTGTHSGEWMGVPASGKKIKVANVDVYRLEDGKFAEHWDVMDAMSIFKQIGGTDVDAVDVMYAASIEE